MILRTNSIILLIGFHIGNPLNQSLSKLSHNKYDFILILNSLILIRNQRAIKFNNVQKAILKIILNFLICPYI
jgi:BarA-like signal transduction histidine kinase